MKQVLIHCKESAEDLLKDLQLFYTYGDGELDVIVPNIEYDPNHYYVDPDEQLCDEYGIDYDQVNCIEAVS